MQTPLLTLQNEPRSYDRSDETDLQRLCQEPCSQRDLFLKQLHPFTRSRTQLLFISASLAVRLLVGDHRSSISAGQASAGEIQQVAVIIFVLSGVSQLGLVTSEGGFGVSLFGLHADSGLMQTATDNTAKSLYNITRACSCLSEICPSCSHFLTSTPALVKKKCA